MSKSPNISWRSRSRRRMAVLLVVFVLFCSSCRVALAAQETGWNVDLVGRWIGGPSNAVAVRDSIVFAGVPGGLIIVDFNMPGAPIELASIALSGPCGRLSLSGPTASFETGACATPPEAVGVAVDGDYAYVSVDTLGLVVVDVSDVTAPAIIGAFDKGSAWTYDVVASGGHLFLTYAGLGLRILDLSSPSNPVEVGYYDTSAAARGVTVRDGLIYVGDGTTGLYIMRYRPPRALHLDVLPGDCPNRLNVRPYGIERGNARPPHGVLPVALLGDHDFDVGDVDLSSLRLRGMAPLRHGKADVASIPSGEDDCACPDGGVDGYADLTLTFSRAALVEAIGATGGSVPLTLVGTLHDGTPFEATDCVQIIGTGEGRRNGPTLPVPAEKIRLNPTLYP